MRCCSISRKLLRFRKKKSHATANCMADRQWFSTGLTAKRLPFLQAFFNQPGFWVFEKDFFNQAKSDDAIAFSPPCYCRFVSLADIF